MSENKDTKWLFKKDLTINTEFKWTDINITTQLSDIPCLENGETLSLAFDIVHDKSRLLEAGKHILRYKSHDLLDDF